MKKVLFVGVSLAAGLALIVACQSQAPGAAVPEPYQGLENPLAGDTEAADAGMALYAARCQSCHGELALGEGPQAGDLNPPPSDLVFAVEMHEDDYLFWRIAEGGQGDPIFSAMPSFSSVLSEEEIWQTITYLHQLAEE